MTTRPLAFALLVALAPSALPSRASAQGTGAEDPTTAMARARFKEGVDYYDKGQYEQARGAFLQAYALKKHPAVLLNLAWSSLKSAHALEAEKYFKQFLAEARDVTDKQRADANDGLNQAHSRIARIEIAAASGTEVTIDGERVGTAPLAEPVAVDPGAHTVKFRGADGSSDTQSVTVLSGEKATARFGKASTTVAPIPLPTNPPATPPPADASPPPSAPPASDTQSRPEEPPANESVSADTGAKSDLLAPPKNKVPAIAGAAIAAAGFVTAIVGGVLKGKAQGKADDVAATIRSHGGGAGTCVKPTPTFTNACAAFASDNNDVDNDALIGNIGLGVGIAGLVGTGLYWVLAKKDDTTRPSTGAIMTPILMGRSGGGLSVGGSF